MSIDKLERNNRRLDASMQSEPANPDSGHGDTRAADAAIGLYAEELMSRFQAYVDWAIANWPHSGQAPDQASFERSRQDLNALCRQAGANAEGDPGVPGGAQFVPVTPMPWP